MQRGALRTTSTQTEEASCAACLRSLQFRVSLYRCREHPVLFIAMTSDRICPYFQFQHRPMLPPNFSVWARWSCGSCASGLRSTACFYWCRSNELHFTVKNPEPSYENTRNVLYSRRHKPATRDLPHLTSFTSKNINTTKETNQACEHTWIHTYIHLRMQILCNRALINISMCATLVQFKTRLGLGHFKSVLSWLQYCFFACLLYCHDCGIIIDSVFAHQSILLLNETH